MIWTPAAVESDLSTAMKAMTVMPNRGCRPAGFPKTSVGFEQLPSKNGMRQLAPAEVTAMDVALDWPRILPTPRARSIVLLRAEGRTWRDIAEKVSPKISHTGAVNIYRAGLTQIAAALNNGELHGRA